MLMPDKRETNEVISKRGTAGLIISSTTSYSAPVEFLDMKCATEKYQFDLGE
jgi:hypothetical protein